MEVLLILALMCAIGAAFQHMHALDKVVNLLHVRVDRCERTKGLVEGSVWIAKVKPKQGRGVQAMNLDASNESDALRQLMAQGITPDRIISLERKGATPA